MGKIAARKQIMRDEHGAARQITISLLTLIIIAIAAGGVYWWQHKKVNDLSQQLSSTQNQLQAEKLKVSQLQSQQATSTTTTSTTTQTTTTPTTQSTNSANPSGPGYTSAKANWQLAAKAISANQNAYFSNAVKALTSGLKTDTGTAHYQAAIGQLNVLIQTPETGVTAAQKQQSNNAIAYLNTFFVTPGLFS